MGLILATKNQTNLVALALVNLSQQNCSNFCILELVYFAFITGRDSLCEN